MKVSADDNPQQRLAYDRTLLANERTYAAWLRTGLAAAAFGFALVHLPDRPTPVERVISTALVIAGAAVIAYGGLRYHQIARDLRAEGTPSAVASPVIITAFTALVTVLIVALLFLL